MLLCKVEKTAAFQLHKFTMLLGVKRPVFDKSADFKIFDDPNGPYRTFNFQYSNEDFDRLHNLMEFNTLLHFEVIIGVNIIVFACLGL